MGSRGESKLGVKRGHYKNTGEWKSAYLAYLREHPNKTQAARAVGMDRQAVNKAKANDPEFAAAVDEALNESIDLIEQKAIENARTGDPRWQTMMIFMLKSHRPERYKETVQNEISGPGGNALTINVVYADAGPTDTDTPTE